MLSSRQRYAVVALVAVWVCGGQSQRSCPGTTLSIITFVPCGRMQNGFEDRSTSSFNAGCDFLVKSAVQLAANHYTSLSANVAVNLTLSAVRRTVPLLQIIGAAAESGIHGIIGPQTLSQSYLITPVITNQLQIPSVTYIHSEEDVVDSELYYRTLPSDSYIVDALVSLLDHLQWYGIAVLSTNEDEYLKQFEMFVSTFSSYVKEETDDLVDSMLIKTFTNEEQLQHSLEHVVDSGINIIVAFVGKQFAAHVMCKASRAGLTASEYVWVLPSYTDPGWWKVSSNDCVRGDGLRCNNCTHSELKNALQSTLFITPSKYPPFTQSNQIYDPRTFREDLLNLTDTTTNRSHLLVHSKALSVYDAVWTIASAWDSVLSAVDCVNSTDLVTKGLKNALREISKLEFQHLWDEKGCVFDDRMNQSQRYYGQVIITQFQDGYICPVGMVLPHNLSSGGTFVPLSETHSHPCPTVAAVGEWIRNFTDPLAANCKFNFYWRDGGDTPRSGFSVEHSAINIPFFTFVCVATMVLAALIICVAIFNLTHAKNKFIKATSPKISLGITLGLLITLPIPVLVGLIQSAHSYGIDGSTADRLCWSIVWTPIFGIAILYSTLHAKNFRLFRIFYNKKLSTKSVLLSNRVLVMSVLLSLVPPIVSCIVSTAASSITHTESNIPLSEDEFSFHYIRASHCSHTNSALLISLAVYLVLLIIPTVLLAYFTMRIKSRFGVDGKGTLATALTLLCGSWIFYLLQDQFDVQRDPNGYANIYYFLVLDIFAGTFLPLCFLYIPPYYYMYKASKKSEVVQKLESEENSKRVEIYNNLRSQAVELRGQVDKIEIKLNLLRTKRCSVDVETQ